MLARDDDGRGDGLVGREDRRGRDGLVGHDHREIERSRLASGRSALDAARDARGPEAGGRGHAALDPTRHGFRADHATATLRAGAGTRYFATARSDRIIANCPHLRKSGHETQSVAIFSGTHRCGTMEKF